MFTDPIKVKLAGYEMDITPILNVLVAFVQKILEIYLPEDLQDTLKDFENM